MYKCEQCGRIIVKGVKQFKKVVQTREKRYPTGHTGHETVKELNVCPDCNKKS